MAHCPRPNCVLIQWNIIYVKAIFEAIDENNDGFLTQEEFVQGIESHQYKNEKYQSKLKQTDRQVELQGIFINKFYRTAE